MHQQYMSHALELAARGRPTVSPNPMVGCVIVKDSAIIATGYHQRTGGPHAEIYALQAAGPAATGATLYVTLEPCCHQGRTPPCTEAIIKAGIKKVYVACLDPNPLVAGNGLAALKAAGIEVEIGPCTAEASQLNAIFFHYIQHKRPFVFAKWAMSLDGKTITHQQDTRDISGPASKQNAHQLRQQVDAILIGANTAIHDDPLLTARLPQVEKQPTRIILASRPLPTYLKLFTTAKDIRTIIATTKADDGWANSMRANQIEILTLPSTTQGYVSLPHLLDELGKREITSLLVEGGTTIHDEFFKQQLVNKVHVYLAPFIISTLNKKQPLCNVQFSQLDSDWHFTADYLENSYV